MACLALPKTMLQRMFEDFKRDLEDGCHDADWMDRADRAIGAVAVVLDA